jgi:rRNA maturation RNase YbeY
MRSASKSKVCFFFEGTRSYLPQRAVLKKFIEKIFKSEGVSLLSLNYIFCTDKRLLEINREYLGHDFYTDIISFELSEGPGVMGEIYISVPRVKDNAQTIGIPAITELKRVMFHGALHLCGYKDKARAEILEMRKAEDRYLELFSRGTGK